MGGVSEVTGDGDVVVVVITGGPVHLNDGKRAGAEEVIGRMEAGKNGAASEFNDDETKFVSEDCNAATTAES